MKDNNYIMKYGWMYNKLNLNPLQSDIYGLIFGFSQDGITKYSGSLNYISKCVNVSRRTVVNVINFLEKDEFIIKTQYNISGVLRNEYAVNFNKKIGSANSSLVVQNLLEGSANSAQDGSANSAPNNTIIDNNIYTKENFLTNWNEMRKKFLETESNLNTLYRDEEDSLNDNLKAYSKEEFHIALFGLFKQTKIPKEIMRFRPKHFLNHIAQYLDAEKNKQYNLYV